MASNGVISSRWIFCFTQRRGQKPRNQDICFNFLVRGSPAPLCWGMLGIPLLEDWKECLVSCFVGFLIFGFLVSWFQSWLASVFLVSKILGFLVSKDSWFLGSKFQRFTNLPFHASRKILIPDPRFWKYLIRLVGIYRHPSFPKTSKNLRILHVYSVFRSVEPMKIQPIIRTLIRLLWKPRNRNWSQIRISSFCLLFVCWDSRQVPLAVEKETGKMTGKWGAGMPSTWGGARPGRGRGLWRDR